MGLQTTHDCWTGSYSHFDRFRMAVAAAVGIDLNSMQRFGGSTSWDIFAKDPIRILLEHSDCEGDIAVADLLPLAGRLDEVAKLLDDCTEDDFAAEARRFAAGCRLAESRGEPVRFR